MQRKGRKREGKGRDKKQIRQERGGGGGGGVKKQKKERTETKARRRNRLTEQLILDTLYVYDTSAQKRTNTAANSATKTSLSYSPFMTLHSSLYTRRESETKEKRKRVSERLTSWQCGKYARLF